LADAEMQGGLDIAGQRINQIQTEYAKISPTTVVVRVGDQPPMVQVTEAGGQMNLFQTPVPSPADGAASAGSLGAAPASTITGTAGEFDFGTFFGGAAPANTTPGQPASADAPVILAGSLNENRYPLRAGVPRRFKTQTVSPNNEINEEDCAQRFIVTARELLEVMKNRVPVEKRTLEVFTREIQQEFKFSAELSAERAEREAQRALLHSQVFDPRELRRALLRKMEAILRDEAMDEANDPEKVGHYLNVILATHPDSLFDAQKAALAATAELQETEDLPNEWVSEWALPTSPNNVYGVVPAELNSWERNFAGLLDRDSTNTVRWWHRNIPHKPWSVNVLLPDGRGFFPDFVIGVDGRRKEDNALLADPKERYDQTTQLPKVLAEHRAYGKVLILYLDAGTRWMTVGYDERAKKADLSREFRLSDMAGF
jgi:hypothetical protein